MTLQRFIAAVLIVGSVLDQVLRATFWVLGRVIVLAFFLLLLFWGGATRTGRQAEYHSRPW